MTFWTKVENSDRVKTRRVEIYCVANVWRRTIA